VNRSNYLPYTDAIALGLDPAETNYMSASWRGHPFGGYDADTKTTFAGLNVPAGAFSGVMQPDRWHVVEILYSEQFDEPVNNDNGLANSTNPPTRNPVWPRLTAIWAAPYGEAPVCLGYVGQGDDNGSGARPSWFNSDRATQLKYQDSSVEGTKEMGAVVVDASTTGCMNPTATQFDCYRNNNARILASRGGLAASLKYISSDSGAQGQYDWGFKDGVLAGSSLGFTSGALNASTYDPPVSSVFVEAYKQFEVSNTEVVRNDGNVVAFNGSAVHRVTLTEAMPIAPSAGDALCFSAVDDRNVGQIYDLPNNPEKRISYTEVICSLDPIPFPGHLGTPLARPWET